MERTLGMSNEPDPRGQRTLSSLGFGCLLLLVLCGIIVFACYLLLEQPWLPFTEPEIQAILDQQYPGSGAHLRGFWEDFENCRVAVTDVNGATRYVKVQRVDNRWQFVEDAGSGGLWVDISCPR